MKVLLALLLLSSSGCLLGELLNPSPPPPPEKCYMRLYAIRRVTISAGDSTWVTTDTTWLGSTEVVCPTPPNQPTP